MYEVSRVEYLALDNCLMYSSLQSYSAVTKTKHELCRGMDENRKECIKWGNPDQEWQIRHVFRADYMVLDNHLVCSPMENTISPTLSIFKMSVVLCMVLRSSRLFLSSLAGLLILSLFSSCLQSCYWDSMCVMSDIPWRHTLTENPLILKLTTFLLPLLQWFLNLRYRSCITDTDFCSP